MATADIKTKVNDASVEAFLNRVPNATRRADAVEVLQMLKRVTRLPPKMWGPSIVGFGRYHYKYDSGREGEMCLMGFSPRAQALTVYIMRGFAKYDSLIDRLGKCSTSVSCLYIRKLDDIDRGVLQELLTEAYRHMQATYGGTVGSTAVSDPRSKKSSASARSKKAGSAAPRRRRA
jgi:hypothetical protein